MANIDGYATQASMIAHLNHMITLDDQRITQASKYSIFEKSPNIPIFQYSYSYDIFMIFMVVQNITAFKSRNLNKKRIKIEDVLEFRPVIPL